MKTTSRSAWDSALSIIQSLRKEGHVALLAGGCVRDRLLGRVPKDYDVATDALPDRVREMFPRARLVGAKFGVMLVRKFGHDIEVATFRTDGRYSDGRRPDSVSFGTELDDARRRDFTVNGLFLDPVDQRIIDHVGGREDLAGKTIRTIGDPDERFSEDHLRMLRAVRLAARLNFQIETATANAIRRLAPNLQSISPERIWMELEQILTEPTRASGWSLLQSLGLRPHLSSHWPADSAKDALTNRRLSALPIRMIDCPLALAAILVGDEVIVGRRICRAFRLSNQTIRRTEWLLRSLPSVPRATALELADFKSLLSNADWESLLDLAQADLTSRGHGQETVEQARWRASLISPEDAAPLPLLTGDDLSALGVSPGPAMGEILRRLYRAQLNDEIGDRNAAIRLAELLRDQGG